MLSIDTLRTSLWRASPTHSNRMELVELATRCILATIVPGPNWNTYYWQRLTGDFAEGECCFLLDAKCQAEMGISQEDCKV